MIMLIVVVDLMISMVVDGLQYRVGVGFEVSLGSLCMFSKSSLWRIYLIDEILRCALCDNLANRGLPQSGS